MEHKDSFKNKAGSNAVTTHADTKRNIPGGISFAITLCAALILLTHKPNRAHCGYQVHRTERKTATG